jgi:enoyl-CoA hydratase/carnithine racemase
MRELVYTARNFTAEEATKIGLVSRTIADKDQLMKEGFELAKLIAEKSPVAVQGSKVNLIYSRDHSVDEGLRFMTAWNGSMLQSVDTMKAAMAAMMKEKPVFSKL